MINQTIRETIPQIPGESDASYDRLIIMLEHEIPSLEELCTYLEEKEPKKAVSISQLKKCSAKDNWTQRRNKYSQIQDEEIKEEMEQLFKELNKKGIHDMQEFLNQLQKLFHQVINKHETTGEYSIYSMFKMFKEYITCYREATEIYYINSRHPLIPDTNTTNTNRTDEKLEQVSKVLYGEDDDK